MSDDQLKSKVQDQFGKNAEKYVKSAIHAKGTDLNAMIEWLTPSDNWVVIDIATGGGHVSKTLSPFVDHVYATDLTPQMLTTARKHLAPGCKNVSYIIADAETLPFLENTFDAAVCRIAAHHFPNPQKFVAEISRVLKPKGKFLLIDNIAPEEAELDLFMNTTEKLRDDSHGRCFTIKEWSSWFEQNDLVITKSEKRRKTFDFPVWVKRTTSSEDQVQSVVKHILNANQITLDYFSVNAQNGEITSFQIDEWMVLTEKSSNPK
ncbi:class I SAM-dependent methyltransferase [Peribacillus sp. SCS-155]|uniref:class I SAM-dependent methyltransferase n=1 Tax=Peribacillus sedimenti TaxID=3115297 RepID=UPI003905BB8F